MELAWEYVFFLIKTITVVIALLVVVAGILAILTKNKSKGKETGHLTITPLNKQFDEYRDAINQNTLDKAALKALKKAKKQQKKQAKATNQDEGPVTGQPTNRLFVLNFQGDIRAQAVAALREEITAILLAKKPQDEVLLRLESGGGAVNAYGLAAAQLERLKNAEIKLTITIDKIAASGGYLMSCLADQIVAAPFAIVGSIGVIAQLPNFHRLLDRQHIDFEQITAGQYKRTLTLFGKNTQEGRHKLQIEVNETHELFKNYIQQYRPQIDITQAATGEHWYGRQALDLKLIDKLATSDDFLLAASRDYALFEVKYEIKRPLTKRISNQLSNLFFKAWRSLQSDHEYYLH